MHNCVGSLYSEKILFRKKWMASTAGVMEAECNSLEKRLKGHLFEVTKKGGNGQVWSKGL